MDDRHVSARVKIDLAALQANYRRLQAQAPKAETGVAIKGEAYGLGLEPCARALWEAGCRQFFVARPKEGEDLRVVLPDARIYVLDGLYAGETAYYLKHRLTPALISLEEAQEWAERGQGEPCVIHVDSGINRLSFSLPELRAMARMKLPLNIAFVMSHLASSEERGNPSNETQRQRFDEARKLLPVVKASFANSSGVFLGEGFTLDITRPGIALYGGNPLPGHPNPMKVVATLEARVLQVREMSTGERIGYNSTWTAARDSRIALIGAGYRDGIPRRMSSTFGTSYVFLGGQRCSIVGRVSMDMTAVDVTDAEVKHGDWAEFFGPHISLDEAAASAGTISWELLTHLGSRYARHYLT
jgi:alanine racemase